MASVIISTVIISSLTIMASVKIMASVTIIASVAFGKYNLWRVLLMANVLWPM